MLGYARDVALSSAFGAELAAVLSGAARVLQGRLLDAFT
jgi:hypothetical protein